MSTSIYKYQHIPVCVYMYKCVRKQLKIDVDIYTPGIRHPMKNADLGLWAAWAETEQGGQEPGSEPGRASTWGPRDICRIWRAYIYIYR